MQRAVPLCHSAFARVATEGTAKAHGYLDNFATAHSCGLRLPQPFRLHHLHPLPQRIRAGCDLKREAKMIKEWLALPQRIRAGCDVCIVTAVFTLPVLCHSAFARVATPIKARGAKTPKLCHSAFARVATPRMAARIRRRSPLPQRIRAGCDGFETFVKHYDELCHSAFARVATDTAILTRTMRGFATAHSRGLRRITEINYPEAWAALPQRIRAGCDAETHCTPRSTRLCHSAFARVATAFRRKLPKIANLCHSAFARVATVHAL